MPNTTWRVETTNAKSIYQSIGLQNRLGVELETKNVESVFLLISLWLHSAIATFDGSTLVVPVVFK